MNFKNKKIEILLNFKLDLLLIVLVVVAIFATYWQLPKNNFISFDDDIYVTNNPHVQKGLTIESIKWAFTAFHAFNWHPLTWLSHMLDYELFGLNPAMHHLMNLLFHVLNSLLLFWILKSITKNIFPSAVVAILFAIHPMHVESVAWISERKDLLSTFFLFLTIGIYFRYVKRQTFYLYGMVSFFFLMGLMAKPMIVTLPFLLLLFDFWPICRMTSATQCSEATKNYVHKKTIGFLIMEKMPLFILSIGSCIITVAAQKAGGIVKSMHEFPVTVRIANAMVSYLRYAWKMIFPVNLSFYYPYRTDLPVWIYIIAVITIISLGALILKKKNSHPFIFVGGAWYLGTLVPVIGFIQVGTQSIADRYTYVPFIGLFIMTAWGIKSICEKHRKIYKFIPILCIMIFLLLMNLSWKQVGYWKNDLRLFSHAVAVTKNNARSNYHLGLSLEKKGNIQKAVHYYKSAIQIQPDFLRARMSLGNALVKQKKYKEALPHYAHALTLKKNYADGHFSFGHVLMNLGEFDKAIEHYKKAIHINADYGDAYYNLGIIYSKQHQYEKAIQSFMEAIRISPNDAEAYNNLGNVYFRQGNTEAAVDSYKRAMQLDPNYLTARKNLKTILNQLAKEKNNIVK